MTKEVPPFLRMRGDDLVLSIVVQPQARVSKIVGEHGGRLKIAVSAPAIEGRANEALIEYFAEFFGVPKRDVELERGSTGKQKSLCIKGVGKLGWDRLLDVLPHSG